MTWVSGRVFFGDVEHVEAGAVGHAQVGDQDVELAGGDGGARLGGVGHRVHRCPTRFR